MNISAPLHKAIGWKVSCKYGGHVTIYSGTISGVDKATCPQCKEDIPLDEVLPILKSIRSICDNKSCNISLYIPLHSCEKSGYGSAPRGLWQ